jgi:hypothetical protein
MEYLIILNPNTRINSIYCNAHGVPEIFTTYKAAKNFAKKYLMCVYQIVAVCNDKKYYLV